MVLREVYPMRPSSLWLIVVALCQVLAVQAASNYMDQSFYFDYTPSSEAIAVPVTAQCETIHIAWERTASSTGPSPSAPYFLQVYTSAFVFPFIIPAGSDVTFDWEVPFGPGTLYQVCMFDKNGYTGGCQQVYTMIANTTTNSPSCSNASFPLGPLDIDAQVQDGPLSQYGWVNQCTDIAITPKNGTPPYTLTIAPTLHPPRNITINDMSTVNWTVDLSWASPFFISVVDSQFNYWSYGPLHSGGDGSTACLTQGDVGSSSSNGLSTGGAVGVGIGGLVAGSLAGALIAFFFLRRRSHKDYSPSSSSLDNLGHVASYHPAPTSPVRHSPLQNGSYQIEPFTMAGEVRNPELRTSPSTTEFGVVSSTSSPPSTRQAGQVYVVHHDGGRAPVTVYHEDGTQVVELPPRYADETDQSPATSDARSRSDVGSGSDGVRSSGDGLGSVLNPTRRPRSAPRKNPSLNALRSPT
ncbi:uncharacterized protein EV420DRAFT_1646166 [Desarmillaria tabescens]|uniref:Fibronectin type-III domain-containing protein n=1 Tax=Armillaria tabescens TaxID=1929756 RepID=A0AA39JYR9_ARMTA|nr:uncharacterized protein EV420DRAFT_1646166 [Desarmillaria tabescens]KAK0451416.1 hypothetical protein EV420DRAFT_1646166 [Desarmillaria tabescens]